jgi:predicted outer membrane repeat protein
MGKHANNQVSGSDNARQIQSRRQQQATTVQGEQRRFRYGEAVTSAHFGSFWHRKGFWITLVIVLELMSQTALAVEQKNEQQEESRNRAGRRNRKSSRDQTAIPVAVASGYRNATRLIQQHFGREADSVVQGSRVRWSAVLPQGEAYRRERKSTRQSFNDRRERNASNLMTSLTPSQAAMRRGEACDVDIVPPFPVTNSTQHYVVNSTADTGPGSLRWAVAQANEHPGPDSVTFSPLINHQNISVTSAPIAITDSIHVAGNQDNTTVINGYHQVPQFFTVSATNVAHLHFTHMALYGGGFVRNNVSGGAIYVPDSEESVYVKVENCFFHDNVASQRQRNEAVFGGALYLGENTASLIQGNVFQLNKVVPLPFSGQAGGSGIYSASTMVIANNTFRQNGMRLALSGSAIYIEGSPQAIALCNNQFYENSVTCPIGENNASVVYAYSSSSQLKITVYDNLFKANGAECDRVGQRGFGTLVIDVPAAQVVVVGSVFESNKYLAVNIISQNTYIYNTSFINNFYAAVAFEGAETEIDDCEFKNNESKLAHPIFLSVADVTRISQVMFKSNRKADGASCISLSGKLTYVSHLMVQDNICAKTLDIHADSAECYVTDSNFQDNIASVGGGISIFGTLHLENTLFKRNSAKRGGGLYVVGGKAYLQNLTFTDNVAANKGGAIYADFQQDYRSLQLLFMNGTVLQRNSAGIFGGGIYYAGVSPKSVIMNTEFRDNHVVGSGIVVEHGRHLYVDTDSQLTIKDSAFYGNGDFDSFTADIFTFYSKNVTYQHVYYHGIMATWQHSGSTYSGCDFVNSFFDLEFSEIVVEKSTINDMTIAPRFSQMDVEDSIFTSIIAFGEFDPFQRDLSKATFRNTVFDMAGLSGGASLHGVIELTNISMVGGYFDFHASDVLIDNCQFINVSNVDTLILVSYGDLILKNIELSNIPNLLKIHRDGVFPPSEDQLSNSSVTILDSHITQSLDDVVYIVRDDELRTGAVQLFLENTVIISGKKNGFVIEDSSANVLITIKNSLLSGNAGSAILVEDGTEEVSINLYYVTATANCGGILAGNSTGTYLGSKGSYITGNTNVRCSNKPLLTNKTLADISGNFISHGYNVIGSCNQRLLSTDKCASDPSKIRWKGQKVYIAGPSAINAGDPHDYPPTDITGIPRPQGRAPDAGANERSADSSWVVLGLIIATPIVILGGHTSHMLYRDYQIRSRLNILRGKAPWCRHEVLENAQVFQFQQHKGACFYRILDKMAGKSSLARVPPLELRFVTDNSDDDDDESELLLNYRGHSPQQQYGTVRVPSTFTDTKTLQDTANHRYWRVRLHEMIKERMTEHWDAGLNTDVIAMHTLRIQKILDELRQYDDYDRHLLGRIEALLGTIQPAQNLLLEDLSLAILVTPLSSCFNVIYGVAFECDQQAQRVRRRNNLSLPSTLRKSYDELSREIDAVQRFYGDFVHDICLAVSKKDAKKLSILCAQRAVILCEDETEARYLKVAATLGHDDKSEGVLSGRDEAGQLNRSNVHFGTHPVRHVEGIYFKHFLQLQQGDSDPNPGFEFMVDSMNKSILNEHVTSASLLVKVFDAGTTYVAQASYGITGRLLAEVLTNTATVIEETKRLNQRNFSAMCISGMLSNPTDGTSMNYVLHEYDAQLFIVGIDNDKAFVPNRLARELTHRGTVKVNVRNIVWLLPQMLAPVDAEFARAFCDSSLEGLILDWLDSLQEQNERYDQFLTQSEQSTLRLPIQFYSGVIEEVYYKLLRIRELLSDSLSSGKPVLHIDLLSHLLPKLGPTYNDLLRKTYETSEYDSPLAAARELSQIPQPKQLRSTVRFFNRVDLPSNKEMITITQVVYDFIANIDFQRATLDNQKKLLDTIRIISYKGESLTINHCPALTNEGLPKMLSNKPNIKRLILRACPNIVDPQATLLVKNRNKSVSVEISSPKAPSFWQLNTIAAVDVINAPVASSSSQARAQQSEQLGEHLLIQLDVDQHNDKVVTLRVLNFRQIPLAQQALLNTVMKAACEKESCVGRAISERWITKVELSSETDAREILCRLSGVLELEAVSELLPAATMPRVAM